MRRIGLVCVGVWACVAGGIAGVAAATGATGAPGATSAATRHRRPRARMLVYAQEWTMYGSRASVPAGRVIVQLWNRGQDPYSLHIRRLNAHGQMTGTAQAVRTTPSGIISAATWKLGKGTYELHCSLPQHLQLGMHTRLTVR